jgi:acrylyl-CoA reductase (NADPH)
LAQGLDLPASVAPFILRGVTLCGIDSVMQPMAGRVEAWRRLATDLDLTRLDAMIRPAILADIPALGAAILKGEVRGRVLVDVNA